MVVGDIVLLDAGSRVPADCLILECSNLEVREINEYGELDELDVHKSVESIDEGDPFLKSDSIITKGACKAIVCCVGPNSTRGSEEKKLNLNEDTPL